MKIKINKEEVDWLYEYNVYAINRDTRLFENTSGVPGITMEIFWDLDEGEVSSRLAERLREGLDYDYALYSKGHTLVGFAYFEE